MIFQNQHQKDVYEARIAATRSKPIKRLSTPDTDTVYFAPPYPQLDGDILTVPGGMADKVRGEVGNPTAIRINGEPYRVVVENMEGEFVVARCAVDGDDLPASEWSPTIGQPEAANSNVMQINPGDVPPVDIPYVIRTVPDNYTTLRTVLDAAFNHAATGKGKERHARDLPFEKQPMLETTRLVGVGFPLGQAIKKAGEAAGMIERGEMGAAEAECLGAINYLAGAVAWMREVKADLPGAVPTSVGVAA